MGSWKAARTSARVAVALCVVGLLVGVVPANGAGGAVICFTSYRLGNPQAVVAPLDDMEAARVLPGQPPWSQHPTISPDGLRVAYTSEAAVYIHDIADGTTTRVTDPGGHLYYPEWSPDGGRLAYWSIGDAEGSRGIYVLDIETKDTELVWKTHRPTRPSWAPTGRELVCETPQTDIIIVDLERGESRALVGMPGVMTIHPSWSPRGGHIAFVSDRDGPVDVYLVDVDGGDVRRLTHEGGAQWPRWTPDGRSVVYGYAQGGTTNLYMMNAEGGPPIQLTDHPARETYPSIFYPAALPVAPQDIALTPWASLRRGR